MAMQGWLLKRNREYRKANLVASKYKRRYVELTADALAYAATLHDLRAGAGARVYGLSDLLWCRAEEEGAKFTVRFPERYITFKSEHGPAERDKWVAALQEALKRAGRGGADGAASGDELDGGAGASTGALPAGLEKLKREARDSLSGTSSAAGSPRIGTSLALGSGANGDGGGGGAELDGSGRPLSPRSLLAKSGLGAAFVSASPRRERASAGAAPPPVAINTDERAGGGDDDEDEEDDEPINSAFAHVRSPRSSCSRPSSARPSTELPPPLKPKGILKTSAQPSPRASTEQPRSGGGSEGGASPQQGSRAGSTSQRRSSLTRMQTPGVLLASEARAASPPAAAPPGGAAQPASPTGWDPAGVAAAPPGDRPGDDGDDVLLLLDPHEPLGAASLSQACDDRGQLQRPTTPLKPAIKRVGGEPASPPAAAAAAPPRPGSAAAQVQPQRHALPPWQQRAEPGQAAAGADLDVDALEAELQALMR
ncbi:hypothetical protein Rsub_04416 [Raphidocelis subcapitata]|uniref:PH domain-containing protein n=1 Tax=Raphidocelis subcapitata TaxID=307507 RepID=A0A2V0NXK1_9CHLO|nr:hypothetical protein Rsub_04416 [Raphidocelis subcapitata]|eukprot:GBF92069.1 hypothetical protein Rsub_04416 [Raphidocelis subcapitata]